MRYLSYFIALGALISGLLISKAETIDFTALQILSESPAYKSDNLSLERAISELNTQANLPDPEIGGEYLVAPVKEDNRWAAELSWGLDWPGVYSARGKEAKMKILAAQKMLSSNRREKFTEIKNLLLDYVQCYKKLQLLEILSKNNDTIYQLANKAVKDGEMTVLDLNKIRLEYANIRGARAALLDEESTIITSLSQIYGRDCLPLIERMDMEFPVIMIPSDSEIIRYKENSPAVVAANAESDAAGQSIKVAKMEAFPSISLGYKHAFEEDTHFNGALLGISVPIFSSKGKLKAAKAQKLEAESKAETAGLEIEAEAKSLKKRLEMLKLQIDEITPLIENVDYNDTLLRAYQGGVISLIEYISERNYFTNAAVELVTLHHAAAKAQASLDIYRCAEF